jgi:hypothetical protein
MSSLSRICNPCPPTHRLQTGASKNKYKPSRKGHENNIIMRTFINGTIICPNCGKQMTCIPYYSATVVNVDKQSETVNETLYRQTTTTKTIIYTNNPAVADLQSVPSNTAKII